MEEYGMEFGEGLAYLANLSNSSTKAFFIEMSPDIPTHGGECRVLGVTESWVTVVFDGKTFLFPLDVAGLRFEMRSPLSLPADDLALIPRAALLAPGLLITAPGGRSLFLGGLLYG
jgi:hypothetical protein